MTEVCGNSILKEKGEFSKEKRRKNMRLVYLLLLTLLFPTAVFAQPYRTVSYDASGRKVITYTCDPNETPEWFKEKYLK